MANFVRLLVCVALVAVSLKSSLARELRPAATLPPPTLPPPTEAPTGDTITLSAGQAIALAEKRTELAQAIAANRTEGDRLFLDDEDNATAPFALTRSQSSEVSTIFPWIGLKPEIKFPGNNVAVCPSEHRGYLIYISYNGVLYWIVNTISVSRCGRQIATCLPQNSWQCRCCEAKIVVPVIGIDIGSCLQNSGICLVKYLPLEIPFCTCCFAIPWRG